MLVDSTPFKMHNYLILRAEQSVFHERTESSVDIEEMQLLPYAVIED